MKGKILAILKETGGFVSGQELCTMLGVSRTAVWKAVNGLKEDGYEIQAVRNRGYLLGAVPDVLTEYELSSKITTQWAGRSLFCCEELDSTNTKAKQLGEGDAPHGLLVVAEQQTAGKGRLGRGWESEPGVNIYMSILLRPQIPPECAPMLTLVAALAVAAGVKAVSGVEAMIKWPNDIVAEGKKICGILTEMSGDMDAIRYLVTGIGINVNGAEFPAELEEKAISLRQLKGRSYSRSHLIAEVMKYFEYYYDIFIRTQDLSGFMAEYNQKMANLDRRVKVLLSRDSYEGVARGITEKGELLVETDGGEIRRVISGEVSVRGIYGYI